MERTNYKLKSFSAEKPLSHLPLSDLFLLAVFAIIPFSNFISVNVFPEYSIAGISAPNFVLMVGLVLICGFDLIKPAKTQRSIALILLVLFLLFVVLLKVLFQGEHKELMLWLAQYQFYFFLPLFCFALKNRTSSLNLFAKASFYAAFVMCIVSIYCFYTGEYFGLVSAEVAQQYSFVGTDYMRMMGLFGSPNVAGAYFLVMLMVGAKVKGINCLFKRIAIALLIICLILTFSRTAAIAAVVYLLFQIAASEKLAEMNLKKVIIPLVIIAFVLGAFLFASNGIYFWSFGSDFYNNPRFTKWINGLGLISENAFLGAGFDAQFHTAAWLSTLSDNSFLLLMAGIGVVPAIIYYFVIFRELFEGSLRRIDGLSMAIVLSILLFFYDFMNFFPVNYLFLLPALIVSSNGADRAIEAHSRDIERNVLIKKKKI